MPAARAHHQHSQLLPELVRFSLRTGELNRAPNRVPQIDLAFDDIFPSRGVRILKISHENFGTGIQSIDHHLAISWSSDFDTAIKKILRNWRTDPIAIAD